jgi:hypothetical protein
MFALPFEKTSQGNEKLANGIGKKTSKIFKMFLQK